MVRKQQWDPTFWADLRPFFAQVSEKQTNAQARFIIKLLGLKKGMTFLDCPCGIGRISLPLARHGIKVTGLDITERYLEEFQQKAERRRLKVEIHHADMRDVSFKNRFDAAGNLWTSFGYFEQDSQNFLVIKNLYQALKPGGKFILHVINRDWIIAHYSDSDWMERGGVISFESRKFDYATSINRGVWRFLRNGKLTSYEINLRMYSFHELLAMFRKAGFVDIQGFGNTEGAPIDRKNMMMWVVGTKPKRM